MARYSQNRFVPVFLVVVIIIVAVVAIVGLARAVFFSGNRTDEAAQQVDISREALLSTGQNRSVQMTIRGPIVADEDFNSYRIKVSPDSRSLVTYRGYLDAPIDRINLDNNGVAYEQFVHALDKANLALGTPLEGDADDTRGICATGRVYEYEIMNADDVVQRLWTSTCSGSPGSLDASVEQLTNLFVTQIPDARTPLRAINL